jgi:acetyltransferase-like isoleucine patch superfamily enzyme
MKRILELLIKKRNPDFKFDPHMSNTMLIGFMILQIKSLVRGMKVILHFRNPRKMLLGKSVDFLNISNIHWGQYLKIGDFALISAMGKKGIHFGNNVGIGAYSRVVISTSLNNIGEHIKIGNNVGIGEFAYLGGAGGLDIGDDCIVGQYFSCHPENHNYLEIDKPIRLQGVNRKGIKIGKNCWIGSKVTILDGVKIGDGCIIAAGAVVNKSFPENSIIGGVPAKVLKTRNEFD